MCSSTLDLSKLLPIWRRDPIALKEVLWPNIVFYRKQREIIKSVRDNKETVVPAANQVGKDFVAGFIILWFFLTQPEPRIVTTSATDRHLEVLWAEVDYFIRNSAHPITTDRGGPLLYTSQNLRRVVNGNVSKDIYAVSRVASTSSKGEGLSGHHVKRGLNLFVCDEASGAPDIVYTMAKAWAKRMLIFGNPHPTTNFFYRAVKEGDIIV